MGQERSEAIVIRGVDFSETSRIVTFLTPNRGKMACMAAGARRAKSAVGSLLDTFNRLEIVYYWKDGRSVQKLGEAALLHGFDRLKANLDTSVYAGFPLEYAYKVAQENEPSQELYATLVDGLTQMEAWQGPARVHAAWQLLRLLRVSGFEPDLSGAAAFDEQDRTRTRTSAVDDLRALSASPRECPAAHDTPESFDALRRYVVRHMDTEFRSLRVIDQLYGRAAAR